MKIIVTVSDLDLRGVPFKRYAAVLGNLIGEGYHPCEWDVLPGQFTTATIDGDASSDDAKDVLSMAKEITMEDLRDGYFG